MTKTKVPMNIKQRLEYLRDELQCERISYAELAELQSLADHIEPGDIELQEAAGVPERVCSNWNWNCSPAECAKEAHKLGWSKQQLVAAMKTFGFSELNINQVVYEFESEE